MKRKKEEEEMKKLLAFFLLFCLHHLLVAFVSGIWKIEEGLLKDVMITIPQKVSHHIEHDLLEEEQFVDKMNNGSEKEKRRIKLLSLFSTLLLSLLPIIFAPATAAVKY